MLRMKSHFSLISSQLLPKSQSLTLDCDFVFLIWQLIHSVLKTHVVADCTGSRRLFYSKSHLSPVPSLLLSKMQTFHWFAFWFFFQCLKTVGHPAFLFILRKAGCPFLISRKIYADRCTRFLRRSRALPHFLGLLPLCRNECLTATANTPDSTDLEKNVWYVNR
jgi:hypothetical protein